LSSPFWREPSRGAQAWKGSGGYHHLPETYLHRVAQFDSPLFKRVALGINDTMRAEIAIKGIEGKRLSYIGGLIKPRRLNRRPKPF
jgi:hypothetical protein